MRSEDWHEQQTRLGEFEAASARWDRFAEVLDAPPEPVAVEDEPEPVDPMFLEPLGTAAPPATPFLYAIWHFATRAHHELEHDKHPNERCKSTCVKCEAADVARTAGLYFDKRMGRHK